MGLTDDDHLGAMAYLRDLEEGVVRSAPSGVGQGSIGYGGGGPVWLDDVRSKRPPTPSELVNAYKAVAFACVNINANAVARVPLRLYVKTAKGQARPRFWQTRKLDPAVQRRMIRRMEASPLTRDMASRECEIEEVMDHPLLDALDSPNPYFDGNLLIQHLCRQLDVLGVAYWFAERLGPDWAPSELWPLHSQYCYPVKGTGREVISGYTYFADTFRPDQVVRFRMISVRDPYLSGYAPLHACYEQLGLVGYYTGVMEGMLKSPRPDALVGPKDPMQPWNKEQRDRMEAKIAAQAGRGHQGRLLLTDGSYDYTPLTHPPADLAGLEISSDARLIAANCFGVPISMLEASDSNRAVASEGATQHEVNAVSPRCCVISSGLTHQYARPVDDRLFFLHDDPVTRNKLEESTVLSVYVKGRILTPNEARAELGYEPRDGGDDFPEPKAPGKPDGQDDDKEKD